MTRKLLLYSFLSLSPIVGAQTEIYNEDFQSGLPVSYSIVDNDGLTPDPAVSEFADAWISLVDPENTSDTIMGSTSFFSPVGQADRWLITDAITLGGYGNIVYWETKSHDPSFPDSYFVMVSSTDTQLSSFTDTLDIVYQENEFWTEHSANLSDLGLDNETVHLAFVNRTYNGFKLYLDDIRVEMEDPSSVKELAEVRTSVYPNPSNNYIKVVGNQKFKTHKIYSVQGQFLLESTDAVLDVSALSPGRYVLVSTSEMGVARSQFIKK